MNTRALELRKRHPASAGTPVPESEENRHEKDQMEPRHAGISRGKSREAGAARELECQCIGVG